jgi:hypothetical protein
MPSHDTTRGLIQLTAKLRKWFRKVTLLHSTGNNKSFPLPTELRTSMSLSGTFPTGFPLHKGAPSLLHSPSMTSPYQCHFISSKYQVTTLYFSSLDLGLLCSRVTINLLGKFPIFLKENFPTALLLRVVCVNLSTHTPSVCESATHSVHNGPL